MLKYINIISMLNVCKKHKKKFFKKKLNRKEFNLIQILLRINILKYVKKIKNNFFIIYTNEVSKLWVHNTAKINKLTVNKKNSSKEILIVSTNRGFEMSSVVSTGVVLAKITTQ